MQAKTYSVTLNGETPLLMHWDNIEWADAIKGWSKDPANKDHSIAGDDRSPAFRWIGCLYVDGGYVVMPSDNLMTMLREGGAKVPTGKGNKTYKAQTQSGIIVNEPGWLIDSGAGPIETEWLKPLRESLDFAEHQAAAVQHGFELFIKRAKIGQSKHIRVRPRFNVWSCTGTLTVLDETIERDILETIVRFAGAYCGLGDWRPSSKTPGPFGKFSATIKEVR